MKPSTRLLLAATAAASLGLLGACGGGGHDSPAPAATGIPGEATASVEGLAAFLRGLVADETGEPFLLDGVTPPTSETTEPADLG